MPVLEEFCGTVQRILVLIASVSSEGSDEWAYVQTPRAFSVRIPKVRMLMKTLDQNSVLTIKPYGKFC